MASSNRLLILLLAVTALAFGQVSTGPGPGPSVSYVVPYTYTIGAGPNQLPATGQRTGQIAVVSDALNTSDCITGGGTNSPSICRWTGTAWRPVAGGAVTYDASGNITGFSIGGSGAQGCLNEYGTDGVTYSSICATTAGTGLTINNPLTTAGSIGTVIAPTAWSAGQNNYNPTGLSTANVMLIQTDGSGGKTWTGLQGLTTGSTLQVVNIGSTDTITIANASASSSNGNKFCLDQGSNLLLAPGRMMTLVYDGTTSPACWRGSLNNVNLASGASVTGVLGTSNGGRGISLVPIYFVTTDFTTAANTSFQAITGLNWTVPANTAMNISFRCSLMYSQATGAAADAFGINDNTVAPTNLNAVGYVYTSASVVAAGNLTNISATGANQIVGFTPSAAATIFNAELSGFIEAPSNGSTTTYSILVKQGTAANVITIKRGSYCYVQ